VCDDTWYTECSSSWEAAYSFAGLATPRSLILVDELGRGTAPNEGVGIAHAIAEGLIEKGVRFLRLSLTIVLTYRQSFVFFATSVWSLWVSAVSDVLSDTFMSSIQLSQGSHVLSSMTSAQLVLLA
jgi:hypothetical protein